MMLDNRKFDSKGKTNHYKVKLLHRYGVSIRLDNRIIFKNGQGDIIGRSEIEEWFIINLPYELSCLEKVHLN